jgi:transcriptional regulator with XRE-family HTH domain
MSRDGHLPFNIALRKAIDARGLSLARLADRLAVADAPLSPATLSNWQRGNAIPRSTTSLRAIAQLETILELPAGALTSTLTPFDDVTRQVPTRKGSAVFHVGRLRASLGTAADDLVVMRLDEYAVVRPDELWSETQMTVRAERTGVDRMAIVVHPDDATRADFEATRACRLGAVRRHNPSGLVAAELIFEDALTRGELYPVSYRTTSPLADEAGYVATLVQPELASYSLTVEFDTTSVPTHIYQVWRQTPDLPHKRIADLRLIANRWAHLWLQNPPPGTHGIRWNPND